MTDNTPENLRGGDASGELLPFDEHTRRRRFARAPQSALATDPPQGSCEPQLTGSSVTSCERCGKTLRDAPRRARKFCSPSCRVLACRARAQCLANFGELRPTAIVVRGPDDSEPPIVIEIGKEAAEWP